MVAPPSRGAAVAKVAAVVVVVAAVLVFAVLRTAKSSRSEPYTLPPEAIRSWTVSVEMGSAPDDPALVLRPPTALTSALFEQTFRRSMESMRAPETLGIPLVYQGELERAAEHVSPDELLKIARRAGLEMTPPAARCLGHRRRPEPDARQQVYFAIFDSAPFKTFRDALAARLGANFDPAFASPAMLVGTVESGPSVWLPLHADADHDCVAPIQAQ
ncbi:MAG TPA: hypothetical protein VHJ20_11695 [Polyangia bacterium]|nr:hypothetical protein [Polyangia bacterium]